jgi:Fe2+ or Zn2+ uptake regulation protein
MVNANPTQKTQEKVLEVIRKSENPMSITAISDATGSGLYAVQKTINFLKGLGIIKTITSSGNTTLVILEKSQLNDQSIEGVKCHVSPSIENPIINH